MPANIRIESAPISREQKRSVANFVLDQLQGKRKRYAFMAFALDESIARPGTDITPEQVLNGCEDGPDTDSAVRSMGSLLRAWLNAKIFDKTEKGREQQFRATMAEEGYGITFTPNHPRPLPTDLARSFWSPHLTHERKTRIIYPEPLFLRDAESVYFRNFKVRSKGDAAALKLQDNRKLIHSFSFVPSGVVMAMLALFEYFQEQQVVLAASPIRPDADLSHDDEHLIVLGSIGTMPHIAQLEGSLPLRIRGNGYSLKGREHKDNTPDDMEDRVVDSVRHAVLTRRTYGARRNRFVTVLSGTHGRAVEGLAQFLCDEAHLKTLMHRLASGGAFPERFQALVEVYMTKIDGEPKINEVRLKSALVVEEPANSRKKKT